MSSRDNVSAQLITESLLSGHGFDLSSYYPNPLPTEYREVRWNGPRLVSRFSVAHAVASLPVALAVRAYLSDVDPVERSRITGRAAGALFTAAALGFTYASLLHLTRPLWALAITLAAAFASPLYSVASRELWNHGPAALLLSMVVWFALRGGLNAAFAGAACLTGIYFVRHAALAPGVVMFLLLHHETIEGPARGAFLRMALIGVATAGLPLAFLNVIVAGSPIGSYAPLQMLEYGWGLPSLDALLAYLVSPGRGLFVFVPITFLAVLGVWLGRRRADARIAWACSAALGAALLEIASYGPWWGGFGFGPRMLTEYVPLLAIMAAFSSTRDIAVVCGFCAPVAAIYAASLFRGGHAWDERRAVDWDPTVVWDWRDSPLTSAVFGPPRPDPTRLDAARLTLTTGRHPVHAGSVSPWLAFGWEAPERDGVWAEGEETWLAFSLPGPGRYALSLSASAPALDGQLQRLELLLAPAGGEGSQYAFQNGLWQYESIRVAFVYRPGVIVLRIKPAHIWFPGHGDVRRCTFYMRWIQLELLDG